MEDKSKKKIDSLALFKDKKKLTFYFGAFTAIVVIVLIAGAIIPSVSTIIRLSAEIKVKKQLYADLQQKANDLENLNQEFDQNRQTFNDMELLFPANKDFSLIMANIEDICVKNGFLLENINFETGEAPNQEVSPTNVLVPRSVTLTLKGKRTSFIPMLKDIEKLPMFPEVISISYANEADDNGNTTYNIQILLYAIEDSLFYH
ncbi:MAG: hypothetical protein Fur003_1090 [Candidatus Dojkabacteria bacterium]